MHRLLLSGLNPALLLAGLVFLFVSGFSVLAATPGSFDEAKRISVESRKPLLIEFFRDG